MKTDKSGKVHKFIIFAHPRSGSTNLSIVLQQHPEIKIAEEPFHKTYSWRNPGKKNHIDFIHDEQSLDIELDELFAEYNGLKVLEYQLSDQLNLHLLSRPDIRIIFLRRKNLLQSLVSDEIATQTHIWYKPFDENLNISSFPALNAININSMRLRLKSISRKMESYSKVLENKKNNAFLPVYYENLYTNDVKQNQKIASGVFQFLGCEIPITNKIPQFLNPEKARMNSHETYRLIPNIDDVEDELGCDETGWLFK